MVYLRRHRKAVGKLLDNEQQIEEVDIDDSILETFDEDTAEDMVEDAINEGINEEQEVVESEIVEEVEATIEAEKKGIFGKKKDKKDKKDEQIEELTDRLKRSMAEFENYRKRTEKEKMQMFETGAKTVIEKILPIVDNFERGLVAVPEEEKSTAFVGGMDMVYKQLISSLEEIGVKQIEAEGKEFDPNLHNAVMHEENEELGENVVSSELQKGYTYRETDNGKNYRN
jgi:molecular chaperone GrpE